MKRVIIFVLIFVLSFLCLSVDIYATDNIYQEVSEEKLICNATTKENFEDDSIIVAFNNKTSLKLSEYSEQDFSEIPVASVESLTHRSMKKIKQQRLKNKMIYLLTMR